MTSLGAELTKGRIFLILFSFLYVVIFTGYYLAARNYEFLWYVAVLVFFFVLIAVTLPKTKFDLVTLTGLSLWGLLHMSGGGVKIAADVLYAWPILPIAGAGELFILKYDQVVHFFGFGVATLAVYQLLKPHLADRPNWKMIYFILILAGAGLGVLNEIVEFIAVLFSPTTGVGGYYNTALDLVFNTLGALAAVVVIHCRRVKIHSLNR